MADDRTKGSIAKVLGRIRWEYVPDRDEVTLLEPMRRYFDDFPWEGTSSPLPTPVSNQGDTDKVDISQELDQEGNGE